MMLSNQDAISRGSYYWTVKFSGDTDAWNRTLSRVGLSEGWKKASACLARNDRWARCGEDGDGGWVGVDGEWKKTA
jgi:hypothetical protein